MINDALKTLRKFHKLKQYEVAEMLSLSKSHVSEIENGNKTPSLEVLEKYAQEFKIPLSSLLFFSEQIEGIKKGKKVKTKMANSALKLLNYIAGPQSE